jgi:hypothetical protein
MEVYMKKYYHILISGVLASCILLFAVVASANITLINGEWSTTFNCTDWEWPPGDIDSGCDGILAGVGSTYTVEVTSAANNPSGDGGKGLAWKVGNGDIVHTSPTSAGLWLEWTGSTHFWIRWYVRFPPGLSIGYNGPNIYGWKPLYIYNNSSRTQSFYVNANYNGVGFDLSWHMGTVNATTGFSDAIGSTTSDGSWVAVEMEFDVPNSTWRYWLYPNNVDNSDPEFSSTNISYPMSSVGVILFPANIRSSGISGALATLYFDDIAISENGRIGPIGSGNTPMPPKGLRIVYPGE